MSKISWRVLEHQDYSFQLGHIITNREHHSGVLNWNSLLLIPADTPTYASTVVGFAKNETGDVHDPKSQLVRDGIPVRTAAAAAMKMDPQTIQLPPTSQSMRVQALETQVIQPTSAYVEASVSACLGRSRLLGWLKRTVYTVTELMVTREADGGFIGYLDDSLWAVRLTKLSRELFGPWVQEECSDGATFTRGIMGVYDEVFGEKEYNADNDRLVHLDGKYLMVLT
ncbi:hypothetical protein PG984_016386 [Apiospora sp. TS-2023a]